MINEYITEWIQNNPLLIEFLILPCLSIIYNEVWNYVKKWFSNYKTRRYQNALAKRLGESYPFYKKNFFLGAPERLFLL